MSVVPILPVPVVDNDDIPAWISRINCFTWHVFSDVRTYRKHRAILRRQDLLAVRVVVHIVLSIALKTFAVRADLDEIIGKSLSKESLMRVKVTVLGGNIPYAIEWKASREPGRTVDDRACLT